MNIHEYQGKAILKSFGVRVQEGIVADTVEQATEAATKMKEEYGSSWVVIKAQIHAGGRGKGGGVKLAKNLEEVAEKAGAILGMQLVTPQTGPETHPGVQIQSTSEKNFPAPARPKKSPVHCNKGGRIHTPRLQKYRPICPSLRTLSLSMPANRGVGTVNYRLSQLEHESASKLDALLIEHYRSRPPRRSGIRQTTGSGVSNWKWNCIFSRACGEFAIESANSTPGVLLVNYILHIT